MRKFYLLSFVVLLCLNVAAQRNSVVRGVAYDTLLKQGLPDATITILEKKDSSLVSFGMTDDNGRFELSSLPNGRYRLLITRVGYHSSTSSFSITDTLKNVDLGS